MSAIEALQKARAAGIKVEVDGCELVLNASVQPPDDVKLAALLGKYKSEIIGLIRPDETGWSALDWQKFLHERAAIGEFDGHLSRQDAEIQAFQDCVRHWLYLNQVESNPTLCAHCHISDDLIGPYLTRHSLEKPHYTWLHQECSVAWHQERKKMAINFFLTIGIRPTVMENDPLTNFHYFSG